MVLEEEKDQYIPFSDLCPAHIVSEQHCLLRILYLWIKNGFQQFDIKLASSRFSLHYVRFLVHGLNTLHVSMDVFARSAFEYTIHSSTRFSRSCSVFALDTL